MALDEVLVGKSLHAYESIDCIVGINVEHVLYCASLRALVTLGNLIYLEPVALSSLCKEEHGVVHGGCIDVLDEVAVACVATL